MGKDILLTWVRECSYNNAYSWVKSALETRVSNEWKLKGRYSLWAADVQAKERSRSAASSGAPPPGGSPAAASQTAHTKKRSRSAVRRQGRRVTARGSHRFRRWGVGVLDEEQPQQPQQSPGLDGNNAEGASPDEPTGEFASAASHAQGWFLQKILAKSDGLSKKPRGLGMQDLPEMFAEGALLGGCIRPDVSVSPARVG